MSNSGHCPECGRPLPPDAPGGICPLCLIKRGIETPKISRAPLGRDRNLLFGVLAIQLGIVSPDKFVEAAAAWATSPEKTLAERLLDTGALTPRQHELIDRFVEEAVRHHDGDAAEAYTSLGGDAFVSSLAAGHLTPQTSNAFTTALGIPLDVNDAEDPEGVKAITETPGRYSRGSEYSRGGMGRVLIVHDEYLAREVALKELAPFSKDDKPTPATPVRASTALVARFLREARVTGQLEHPAIVPVYELGRRADGAYYYTMKLVRGQTLRKCIAEAQTLDGRLALLPHFLDLCNAVAYAHSRGVIHRDLKPDNVMIGGFGETVLIDWGLAKVLGRRDEHEEELRKTLSEIRGKEIGELKRTETGVRMGTPHYMSPEQAEGRIHQLDERSDIFSLGVMLYEFLTGKLPFGGRTTDELIEHLIYDPPTPIASIEPDVPPELISICVRALQKKPNDRYQSALEFAEEIQRFQTGAMVKAYRYSLREMFGRYYRRHRPAVRTAIAAAGIIILTGIVSYINVVRARDDARHQRDAAKQNAYVAQIRLAKSHLDNYAYDLAYNALWDADESLRDWEWGHLLLASTPRYRTLKGNGLDWSPDGSQLATFYLDQSISIWNGKDLTPIRNLEGNLAQLEMIRYSPDGTRLAAAGAAGFIGVWDVASGRLLFNLQGHTEHVATIDFSPDGTRLLSASHDHTVRLWDLQTGRELSTFTDFAERVYFAKFSPDGSVFAAIEWDKSIKVIDPASQQTRFSVVGERAAFAANGARLVTTNGMIAEVWDVTNGSKVGSLAGHRGIILDLAATPNASIAASGSVDGTARIWDLDTFSEIRSVSLGGDVRNVGFSSDARSLVTQAFRSDGVTFVREIDTVSGDINAEAPPLTFDARHVLVSPAGPAVAMVSFDRMVRVLDTLDSPSRVTIAQFGAERYVYAAYASQTLAVQTRRGQVQCFDTESGLESVSWLAWGSMHTTAPSFGQNGQRLVAFLDPFLPVVLDVKTHGVAASFSGHIGCGNTVRFSPDGTAVLSAGADRTPHIWNSETGAELFALEGHADEVLFADYSPNGRRIVTASRDATARVWDASTGAVIHALLGHEGPVRSAVVLDDGRILTGGDDHEIRVWDGGSGALLARLSGHVGSVVDLLPRLGERRFVSAAADGTLGIWDADSLRELVTLEGGKYMSLARVVVGQSFFVSTWSRAVKELRAAPWRLDQVASLPGNTPQAKYAAHAASDVARPVVRHGGAIVPMTIVTSMTIFQSVLDRLVAALGQSESLPPGTFGAAENGMRITGGVLSRAVAPISLDEGDSILEVNGVRLDTADTARQSFTRLRELADPGGVTMRIESGGGLFDSTVSVLPVVDRERTVQLPVAEVIQIIEDHVDALTQTRLPINAFQEIMARSLGEERANSDALLGYWLGVVDANDGRFLTTYRKLGLSPYTRIRNVNGQDITGFQQFHDLYVGVLANLRSDRPSPIQMDIEKGMFIRERLTIVPSP